MRDYPHPAGKHGIGHPVYRCHARKAWGTLTPAQKKNAVRAAPNAPGKEWLGHWLNDGREAGEFEIVERRAVTPRVWVCRGTPPWDAWVDDYRAEGRRLPTTEHRIDGRLQTGWWFESEWPPILEDTEHVGGMQ